MSCVLSFSYLQSHCFVTYLKIKHPVIEFIVGNKLDQRDVNKPLCVVVFEAISRVVSGQSMDSSRGQVSPQKIDRHEATAVQAATSFISQKVSKSVHFALELFSHHVLTKSQMDKYDLDKLGQDEGSDNQLKVIQNFKLLMGVQETISKEPDKFNALCIVLEKLEYNECSEKLNSK